MHIERYEEVSKGESTMKQVLLLVFLAVLGLSGCLLNPSTDTYPETLTEGDLTFHPSEKMDTTTLSFSVSLDGKSGLFKAGVVAAVMAEDALTAEDREVIFAYRKARVDSIQLSFQIKKDSKYESFTSYTLPIIGGVCSGDISLPRAKFLLTASSVSKSGPSDFEGTAEIDTRELLPRVEIIMTARPYIQGGLKIFFFGDCPKLADKLTFGPLATGTSNSFEMLEDNILYIPQADMQILATRFDKSFTFTVGDETFRADGFNVLDILDDGTIEVFARSKEGALN